MPASEGKVAPLQPPPKKVDKVLAAFTFVLTSDLMPKEQETGIKNEVDGSETAEGRVCPMKIRCATEDFGAVTIMILVFRPWDLRNSTITIKRSPGQMIEFCPRINYSIV
jgi:hypothetical protein